MFILKNSLLAKKHKRLILQEGVMQRNFPIFVITTAFLSDRHAHIRHLEEELGFRFRWIFEHDIGDTITDFIAVASEDLPASSASCLKKHIYAQMLIIENGFDVGMIIEDDCLFYGNFRERFVSILSKAMRLEPGWLVFLGGGDNRLNPSSLQFDDDELIISPITTAEAYLVDREGCRRRLDAIRGKEINLPADHLLKHLDENVGIIQYKPVKPLATQGSISGLFHTTLDASRSKHSKLYLACKYYWNRFRRQLLPRWFYRLKSGLGL